MNVIEARREHKQCSTLAVIQRLSTNTLLFVLSSAVRALRRLEKPISDGFCFLEAEHGESYPYSKAFLVLLATRLRALLCGSFNTASVSWTTSSIY